MALQLTADDSSPLITYSPAGAWLDTPVDEPLRSSYYDNSFHRTSTQGATATFKFSGTRVTILGAQRPGYGTYSISIDDTIIAQGSADSPNPLFQRVLGEAAGLRNGPHTAIITNTGSALDIDSVSFVSEIGPQGSEVPQILYDDNNPRVTYSPSPSAWKTSQSSNYFGGGLGYSDNPNASASMSFTGQAIAVYGTTAPDHADVRIILDGQETMLKCGSGGIATELHTKTLMFYAEGLDSSQPHQISISSVPQPGAPYLDLDGIAVFGATQPGPSAIPEPNAVPSVAPKSNSGNSSTQPSNASISREVDKRVIIGSVCGGVACLSIIGLLILFLRWRRQRRNRQPLSPVTPADFLPIQRPDTPMMEGSLDSQHSTWSFPKAHSSASSSSSSTPVLMPIITISAPPPPSHVRVKGPHTAPTRPSRPPTFVLPSSI